MYSFYPNGLHPSQRVKDVISYGLPFKKNMADWVPEDYEHKQDIFAVLLDEDFNEFSEVVLPFNHKYNPFVNLYNSDTKIFFTPIKVTSTLLQSYERAFIGENYLESNIKSKNTIQNMISIHPDFDSSTNFMGEGLFEMHVLYDKKVNLSYFFILPNSNLIATYYKLFSL